MPNYNTSAFCGGLTIVLVDIPPTPATSCFSSIATPLNPTCGNNNGDISIATVGGAPPYTYTWTPAVSTTASASNLSAGTYTIIVSDAACQDTSIVVTLTTSGPTGIANMTIGEKCFGDCNATATETITGGVPPYTYSWAPGGQTTATATGLCAQTYTFTATDNIGCTGTATVNVTQPTLLTAADVPTNAVCNGGTGSIIVTPGGGTAPYTYAWTPSAQTNATATGLTAGTYTATVTDNNGCTATASATITQPAALSVVITGPATLCMNGTGTLTATPAGGTAPYTYAWSPGNTSTSSTASITLTATTTYSALVTDVNGCTTTGTFTVTLENPATLTVTATKPSICEGLSTTLMAAGTNLTGAFTWQPGNLTGPVVAVTPTVTTTYTVSVPTFCGIATSTITIYVNALPVTAFGTDNASGCYPFCVQFKNLSTSASGSIVQWVWALGNGDTISSQNPIYCYPNSGSYDVTLTTITDSGCSSTLKVANYINVYSHPNASFTMSPQPTTIINSDIQFTDKSTDAYGIAYWSWNFGVAGNDTLSSLQNPTYKYWDTGTYCPTEVVMNIHGCTDSVTNCLEISPLFEMYIPSSFTPNGDGRNDVFLPIGKDVKSFEMYVYDRWGMQLFHTTDIYNGWPGTVKGGSAVCQEDTYVYVINAFDNKNQKHSYIGAVNLIK